MVHQRKKSRLADAAGIFERGVRATATVKMAKATDCDRRMQVQLASSGQLIEIGDHSARRLAVGRDGVQRPVFGLQPDQESVRLELVADFGIDAC